MIRKIYYVFTCFLMLPVACGRTGPPLPYPPNIPSPPEILIVGRHKEKILVRTARKIEPFLFRFYFNNDLCSAPVVGKVGEEPWEGWYSFPANLSGSVEFLKTENGGRSRLWNVPEEKEESLSSPVTSEILSSGEIVFYTPPGVKIFFEKKSETKWEPLGLKLPPFTIGPLPPNTTWDFLYTPVRETTAGIYFLTFPQRITFSIP